MQQAGGQGLTISLIKRALIVALSFGVGLVSASHALAPVATIEQKKEVQLRQLPPKAFAQLLIQDRFEQPEQQYRCLAQLWGKESAWNYKAKSKSHDYGIPQRHMKNNTQAEIADFMQHPHIQIKWGLNYIEHRYDTPCKALQSWLSRADKNGRGGWY